MVFAPFGSVITLTRSGPKNAPDTAAATFPAAPTSDPPTKIAVCFRSPGPRVKIAP